MVGTVPGGGEPQDADLGQIARREHFVRAARQRRGLFGRELARPLHGRERDARRDVGREPHLRLARIRRGDEVGFVLLQGAHAGPARQRIGLRRIVLGNAVQIDDRNLIAPEGLLPELLRQRRPRRLDLPGAEPRARPAVALPSVHGSQTVAQRRLRRGLQLGIHRDLDGHPGSVDGGFAILRDQLPADLVEIERARRLRRHGRKDDGLLHLGVVLGARDVAVREHAIEDVDLPALGAIGMAARIDARRVLREPGEDGRLAEVDFPDVLVEVVERSFLDAVAGPAEIDLVQVEKEDVVLGEVSLQARGEQDLFQLPLPPLLAGEEEVLHHLLRDGGGAEPLAPAQGIDDGGTDQGDGVDPRMLVEILVFGGDDRLQEDAGDLLHRNHRPAFLEELPDHRPVPGDDVGGHEGAVVLHGVEGRNLARQVQVSGEERDRGDDGSGAAPGQQPQEPRLPSRPSGGKMALVIGRRHRLVRF